MERRGPSRGSGAYFVAGTTGAAALIGR